jgi:hypothetical protein
MIQKLKLFIHRYVYSKTNWCYIILGLTFDKRKWYYSKSDFEMANKDWNSTFWFLHYEVVDKEGNIDPDYIRIFWHWRFSYALRNWYLRKPLLWITLGWLLRAVVSA